jgi:hypothetical protein
MAHARRRATLATRLWLDDDVGCDAARDVFEDEVCVAMEGNLL